MIDILVKYLFLILLILVCYQIFTIFSFKEPFETNDDKKDKEIAPYDNTSYMLAQKNAANIQILDEKLKELSNLTSKVNDIETNVNTNSNTLDAFIKQQENDLIAGSLDTNTTN